MKFRKYWLWKIQQWNHGSPMFSLSLWFTATISCKKFVGNKLNLIIESSWPRCTDPGNSSECLWLFSKYIKLLVISAIRSACAPNLLPFILGTNFYNFGICTLNTRLWYLIILLGYHYLSLTKDLDRLIFATPLCYLGHITLLLKLIFMDNATVVCLKTQTLVIKVSNVCPFWVIIDISVNCNKVRSLSNVHGDKKFEKEAWYSNVFYFFQELTDIVDSRWDDYVSIWIFDIDIFVRFICMPILQYIHRFLWNF